MKERATASFLTKQLRLLGNHLYSRRHPDSIKGFAVELHSVSQAAVWVLKKYNACMIPARTTLKESTKSFTCGTGEDFRLQSQFFERTQHLMGTERAEFDEIYNDKKLKFKAVEVSFLQTLL